MHHVRKTVSLMPLVLGMAFSAFLVACDNTVVVFGDGEAVSSGSGGGSSSSGETVSTSGTSGNTVSTVSTSGTGTTSGQTVTGGGVSPTQCADDCEVLYDCGIEDGNCPGFDNSPADHDAFVDFCVAGCADFGGIGALLHKDNCSSTVDRVAMFSPEFSAWCFDAVTPD